MNLSENVSQQIVTAIGIFEIRSRFIQDTLTDNLFHNIRVWNI